jgi:DNA-binding NarL/FixJ family response regulator
MSKRRVVCIDDNEWIGESIQRMIVRDPDLEWAGWLPAPIPALELVSRLNPDLVLLDVDIPGHDALELIADLAQNAPDVQVVMLSGHVRHEYIARALEAGAWGYIYKGEEVPVIRAVLATILAGNVGLSPTVEDEYTRAPRT